MTDERIQARSWRDAPTAETSIGSSSRDPSALPDLVARFEALPTTKERTTLARDPSTLALARALHDSDAPTFAALCDRLAPLGISPTWWRKLVSKAAPAVEAQPSAPMGTAWREPAPQPPAAVREATREAFDDGAVDHAPTPAPAAPSTLVPLSYTSARFDDPDDLSGEACARRDTENQGDLARYFASAAEVLASGDRKTAQHLEGAGSSPPDGVPDVIRNVLRAIGKGRTPDPADLTAARTVLERGPGACTDEGAVNDRAPTTAPSWAAELGIIEHTGADAAADAREAQREAMRDGAPDPLDGLTDRITSAGDAALAFDALAIGAALDLRDNDGPAFQSLRSALKRAGVGLTEWSKALDGEAQRRKRAAKEADREGLQRAAQLRREAADAAREALAEKLAAEGAARPALAAHNRVRDGNGATFVMEPGRIVMESMTNQGLKRVELARFSAPIVAEVLELDAPDAKPRRTLTLSVSRGGEPWEVDLDAGSFERMEWPVPLLGSWAAVASGKGMRDALRYGLQLLSTPETRQRCAFTGWVRHGGQWVYLHAGGAIGAEGAVEGLAATPPSPVDRFALPVPPVGDELARAVVAVVELLSMEPAAVTVPMVALAFHAPLGGSRCAVHVNGPAERGKSVRASLVQRLFGAAMNAKAPPASWADGSTAIGISQVLARAGDALVMIDDLRVSGGSRDEADAVKVDRVLRAHFNGAAPLKGRREGGGRTDPASRCNVLSTGETLPKGPTASTLNRVVTVELDAPLPANIGELDARASAGELAAGMAAFLRWLAPQVEGLRPRARAEERAAATRWGFTARSRATELLGGLCLGMEFLLRFLAASGVPAVDVERHRARAIAALHVVAGEHGARVAEEGIAARFVGLVAQGLRSGLAHVVEVRRAEAPGTGLRTLTPEDPLLWGYQRRASDLFAAGPLIGYLIRTATTAKPSPITEAVCLAPAAALALARKVERENGRSLGADRSTVGAALAAAGMLARTELDGARRRETTRVRTSSGGPLLEVWSLKLSALGYGASDTDDGADELPSAPVDDGTGPAPDDVPEFPADVDPFAP